MQIKKRKYLLITSVFLLCSFSFVVVNNTAKSEMEHLYKQQKMTSHLLVNLLMHKIDQGEIAIFGSILKQADVQSSNVAYVHNLVDDKLTIQLFFKLKKRLLVPNFEAFIVEEISIDIDEEGNIIEIVPYLSQLDQTAED